MSSPAAARRPGRSRRIWRAIETIGAWLLGILWLAPLAYAFWAAFHDRAFAATVDLTAPLTLDNLTRVWSSLPFDQYYVNTILLVSGILAGQLILGPLAAFAFARYPFRGHNIVFGLLLVQLMIYPEVLISENYRTMATLGLVDTLTAIGLPYVASAFGIFLMRQQFKSVPAELDDAAAIEGCTRLQLLWRVYLPLARPTLVAYGLVSVSYHWNNFLWPLVITNSVESRPLTVGLAIFSGTEAGINWTDLSTATVIVIAPLLIAFLVFQRQFVQSFMRAGIR